VRVPPTTTAVPWVWAWACGVAWQAVSDMIAGVTTLWVNPESYHLFTCPSPGLPAWASSPPSARWHKRDGTSSSSSLSRYLEHRTKSDLIFCCEKVFPVSYLCAHRDTREQVPPKPLSSAISARGVPG
jgi:hypothetical protein